MFEPSARFRPIQFYNRDLSDLGEHLGPKPFLSRFPKHDILCFEIEPKTNIFPKMAPQAKPFC